MISTPNLSNRRMRTTLAFGLMAALSIPLTVTGGPYSWTGNGPLGGAVTDIVVDPTDANRVFAATSLNGVFVSTDQGMSWANVGNLERTSLRYLAVANDGVLYTTTSGDLVDQVSRSADSGNTWTSSSTGLPANNRVLAIATAPTQSSRVLVSAQDAGLFLSTDSGSSFAATTGLPPTGAVTGIVFSPTSSSMAYVSISTGGVYKSIDGGASWNVSSSGLPLPLRARAIAVDHSDADRLFVYSNTAPTGVYRSTDAGATWSLSSTGLTGRAWDFSISPDDPTFILATTNDGVFRSTDGGSNWTLRSDMDGLRHTTIVVLPTITRAGTTRGTSTALAGSNRSLQRTIDSGSTWAPSVTGLNAYQCTLKLWASSDNPREIYCGEHQSNDGGVTWTEVLPIASPFQAIVGGEGSRSTPDRHYAATAFDLYRSDNRGATWTQAITDTSAFGIFGPLPLAIAIHPTDHNQLVLANGAFDNSGTTSGPAFLRSIDGGATFTGLFTPTLASFENFSPWQIFIDPSNPQLLLASVLRVDSTSRDTEIWVSDSGGASWNSLHFPDSRALHLARSPSNTLVFYATIFDNDRVTTKIERSDNGGLTFASVPTTPPCRGFLAVGPTDPDEVFLACEQLYQSTDGGLNWTLFDTTGLPADVNEFLELMITDGPRRYVASTNAGVFEYVEQLFGDSFEDGTTSGWSSSSP